MIKKKNVFAIIACSVMFGIYGMELKKASEGTSSDKLKQQQSLQNKQDYLQELHIRTSLVDAFLNRDIKVLDDETLQFVDYADYSVSHTLSLKDVSSFFKLLKSSKQNGQLQTDHLNKLDPANVRVALAMYALLQQNHPEKSFLQDHERLEHKVTLLEHADEEDKLVLQKERYIDLSFMKPLNKLEEQEVLRLITAASSFEEFSHKLCFTGKLDKFGEHWHKLISLRKALKVCDIHCIKNNCMENNDTRVTINDYINASIASLKKAIARRDNEMF